MRHLTADLILTPQGLRPRTLLSLDTQGKVIDLKIDVSDYPGETECFSGILLPGMVNTHCHLELSHLKGKVDRGTGLPGFAAQLMAVRDAQSEMEKLEAAKAAEAEMLAEGIVAVGDISNGPSSFPVKAEKKLRYHTFIELIGLHPERAAGSLKRGQDLLATCPQTASFAPHAPYSVGPDLIDKIFRHSAENRLPTSLHNQESEAEEEFFRHKTGAFTDLYKRLGIPLDWWAAPGTDSLSYLLPHFSPEVPFLLVHNTFTPTPLFSRANEALPNLYWCACPRANLYIEGQLPDYPAWIEAGNRITLGTDSLASNDRLSLLHEMQAIHAHYPDIPLEKMLHWATENGAQFLNLPEFGSFSPGKRPGVNLLEGIDPEQLQLKGEERIRRLC